MEKAPTEETKTAGRMNLLCISVKFLSPFYHGNPIQCDSWPPSPARLFQALTCAARLGANMLVWEKSEKALKWLEAQDPPEIISCDFQKGREYTQYGPSNNWECKELLMEWIENKEPCPLGTHPSFASFSPTSHLREKHIDEIECAPVILFERTKNELSPAAVHYVWKIQEGEENAREICRLAEKIVALGWGTDMVIADAKILSNDEAAKISGRRFIPEMKGKVKLDVPYKGFLQKVLSKYEEASITLVDGIYRKPTPLERHYQNYRDEGETTGPRREHISFFLLHPEREEEMRAFSPSRWAEIAAWMRHAMAEALEGEKPREWINEVILGHNEGGQHPCFIPVPSVGHPQSDGFVRRGMITWEDPISFDEERLRELLENRLLLSDPGKKKMAILRIAEDNFLKRFVDPANVWVTVSPIILHGHDQRHGKFSLSKCHKLILQAFCESGYSPEIIEKIWFQKAPMLSGSLHVSSYFVPEHLSRWPRYHILVKFRRNVLGPVLVGIGRHYGLGFFISAQELENLSRAVLDQK